MAEDAVDAVLKENAKLAALAHSKPQLSPFVIDTSRLSPSNTMNIPLIGSAGWSLQLPTALNRLGLDKDVSTHLSHSYGDKAFDISHIIAHENKKLNKRLAMGYPFIEAEVVYAARHEYAFTAVDMIANRIRLVK